MLRRSGLRRCSGWSSAHRSTFRTCFEFLFQGQRVVLVMRPEFVEGRLVGDDERRHGARGHARGHFKHAIRELAHCDPFQGAGLIGDGEQSRAAEAFEPVGRFALFDHFGRRQRLIVHAVKNGCCLVDFLFRIDAGKIFRPATAQHLCFRAQGDLVAAHLGPLFLTRIEAARDLRTGSGAELLAHFLLPGLLMSGRMQFAGPHPGIGVGVGALHDRREFIPVDRCNDPFERVVRSGTMEHARRARNDTERIYQGVLGSLVVNEFHRRSIGLIIATPSGDRTKSVDPDHQRHVALGGFILVENERVDLLAERVQAELAGDGNKLVKFVGVAVFRGRPPNQRCLGRYFPPFQARDAMRLPKCDNLIHKNLL